jgi:drug/metabolite transporter (DMT)-like permease
MLAQLLAILSAVLRATMAVAARKGLKDSNPVSGVIVITSVMACGLLILAAPAFAGSSLSLLAISAFVVDGVLIIVIARLLFFMSMERVGASVSMSVLGSQPLFAALFAIVFLNENFTMPILLGTFLIVAGILLLSENSREQGWRRRDLLLSIVVAILYGASSPILKVGLNEVNSPIVGGALSSGTGFIAMMFYLAVTRGRKIVLGGGSIKFFCLAGIFQLSMVISIYTALWLGKVVVVVPLYNTAPLFTLLGSYFFLHGIERISPRIVIGAILMVAGAALVAS